MDKEWMYKTSRLDPSYLEHVTKFIAATKRHRLGLKREHTVCPCKSYKNLLLHEDNVVKSHLVRYGFVKDYIIWKFHEEAEDLSGGASGGILSTTMMTTVIAKQQTSSAVVGGHSNAATGDNNADRDYIMMDDLLQDMADDDGSGGGDDGDGGKPVRDPETVDLFESIANHLDHDDVLFGSPSWLENFREMMQTTIDPLYKDCLKHWMALCFNLQMLMLKARHGWSDTSFNDLLCILADTNPEGNMR
jgi:hypothetical protein